MEEVRDKIAEQFLNEVLGEGYLEEHRLFLLVPEDRSSINIMKSWPVFHTWIVQGMSMPYDDREVFRPVLKEWVSEVFNEWFSCNLEVEVDPVTGEKRPVKHVQKKEQVQ